MKSAVQSHKRMSNISSVTLSQMENEQAKSVKEAPSLHVCDKQCKLVVVVKVALMQLRLC